MEDKTWNCLYIIGLILFPRNICICLNSYLYDHVMQYAVLGCKMSVNGKQKDLCICDNKKILPRELAENYGTKLS